MTISNPLFTIMAPRSIAFFGAGNNPGKMGSMQFLNLLDSRFPGEILPVHPREKTVLGIQAFASVEALPQTPELAILVLPAHALPEVLTALGEKGTRHAVIISAGFSETGEAGEKRIREILSICRKYNIRFIGPNCMGIMNTTHPFNCTVAPFFGAPGHLGMIAQSGTYIGQVIEFLRKREINFSKAISTGNESSIDLVDCLEYMGEDEETRAIGMYIESIRNGDRFLEVARKVSRKKPIVVQYVGGTRSGARSGASHTGAIAGPDYIYNGLFEQAGVIRVNTIEEVYTIGNALAHQPLPKGPRIGLLTNSGGPATAMATTLDMNGLEVPELSQQTRDAIDPLLPPSASSRNPVDVTFHPDISLVARTLPDIMMQSSDIDGLIVHGIMGTGWLNAVSPLIEKYLNIPAENFKSIFSVDLSETIQMPSKYGKPMIVSSFFQKEDDAAEMLMKNNIPVFDGPEKAAKAMATLYQYFRIKNRKPDDPDRERPVPEAAANIMANAGQGPLDEFTAKRLLNACGIPVCREVRVNSSEEAVEAAESIGFPVAVKGCSAEILHKTEKGLVHLNLKDAKGVADACGKITTSVGNIPFLVCEMVDAELEVMAGLTRFPGFPPAVLFGLGGIHAEILKDSAVRLAPFGLIEAMRQITSIRAAKVLEGYRGAPPTDTAALADILVRLGHLALFFPEIKEMDLNPILIRQGQPVVVDALIIIDKNADS